MALISICEEKADNGAYHTVVNFDNGSSYSIVLRDPFTDKQEELLEWYFEQYLSFPFIEEVKFKDVATAIIEYGEHLFKQVFPESDMSHDLYQMALSGENLSIEIIGSPNFHHFHWEAMKHPHQAEPLALSCAITRKVSDARLLPPITIHGSSPTINVLLLVARPKGQSDVGYRTISRPLVETLQSFDLPVKIDIVRPGTFLALREHLEKTSREQGRGYYHLFHFDGHGTLLNYKAFLLFSSSRLGRAELIEASQLANLLEQHAIPMVVLNACQSAKQLNQATETSLASRLQQAGVQAALAMAYSVTVTAATQFMTTLYRQLFAGASLSSAVCLARRILYTDKTRRAYFNQPIDLEDWLLPVVYQQGTVALPLPTFTPAAEMEKMKQYVAPATNYGFVGRDLDVLAIEQRLLATDNELLIQGLGGVGKTTLLRHLGQWWQVTHLVERVFYFGYDEWGWYTQQIIDTIARQLYGDTSAEYLHHFQPLPPAVQQQKLVDTLRATRHLLILDNLESITGTTTLHTLSPAEQAQLQQFLAALQGGKTLVLLGSRSEEAWLAKGTFGGNVYALSGLDPEARTELANQILQRYQVSHYRQDADFQQLMKLLAGYPLAMEVVLRNLEKQSPTAVLQALTKGDAQLDFASADKTQSLLRCIEYSHSNLSADAQALLGCLAPFTGVIGLPALPKYLKRLQQQPALAHLPFDQWDAVLQEAIHWGLLKPYPDFPDIFLQIQPIFPYFLRNRLQTMPTDYQQAIQTAFRDYYDKLGGGTLRRFLDSKQADEKQVGAILAQLEYENLYQALKFALSAHVSIENLYRPVFFHLYTTKDQARGLQLSEMVVAALQQYPAEQLQGPLGIEFFGVLDSMASQQLGLKQYALAEQTYLKNLELINILTEINKEQQGKMIATTYHSLGIIAQEQRQWQQAQDYYQLAIKIEFNDRYLQAGTYHQLGRVAEEQRHWKQAQDYYQQSLDIFIEFNDRHSQAKTYYQLGRIAEEQWQWKQAYDYYQHALPIYIEFNDHYGQAAVYHQLGRVTEEQRQWKQAQNCYQQALAIYIDFNDRYEQADIYLNLGILVQEQRQWEQAHTYYQQSLAIYNEFNDRHGQAKIYQNLGTLAGKQEQWSEVKSYLLTALRLFMEFADEYYTNATLGNLARVYQHTPDDSLLAAVGEVMSWSEEEVLNRLNQDLQD